MNQKEKAEAIKRQLVIINKLLKKPENKFCADCKRTSPSWASINLGVFVCINCSGCHREIGVHVTKIKSVNLDVWAEDTLKYFQKINNEIANEYWEYKLNKFDFKSIQNDNYKLIKFIRDKYEYKKWANKKKKDPMSLIMLGKFKNKKKHEETDDEEDNEENNKSIEDNEEQENNNENESDNDNNEEEFEEVQEKEIKHNKNKINNNNNIYNQYTPPVQQINNIFVINNNIPNNNNAQNNNILEEFNNNNNSSNLLDFNVQTEKDIKSHDLLSNIQNAYNNYDPNIDNDINNLNKMNNMIFNMNLNNKSPQFNLVSNNNNMFKNNNMNNNFVNYKPNNNLNNNNVVNNSEAKSRTNPIAFNLDYLNKNLSVKASNDKKKKDPFSDLVSFK